MTERYFFTVDQDGPSYVTTTTGKEPRRLKGFPAPVEVPRMPGKHERWDKGLGRFVLDSAAEIDELYAIQRGAAAIAQARAMKALEARLILAGVAIDGFVAAEARATGQDPIELASIITEKALADVVAEAGRIARKRDRAS